MGFQSVTWTSCSRLSCAANGAPADVILCVDPTKVAASICPGQEEAVDPILQDFTYHYIQAQLISYTRVKNGCGGGFYQYVFYYDDAQLVDAAVLLAGDITGAVCKGCLTTWVEDFVGYEPTLLKDDSGTYTYSSPHACDTLLNLTGFGDVDGNFRFGEPDVALDGAGVISLAIGVDPVTAPPTVGQFWVAPDGSLQYLSPNGVQTQLAPG